MLAVTPATSTNLVRTTVHKQYSVGQGVIGVRIAGIMTPIRFSIHSNKGGKRSIIVVLGDPAHKYNPYQDYGVLEKICRRIVKFNIRHFYKCFLPTSVNSTGKIGTPYKMNKCQKCDVSLKDCNDRTLQIVTRKRYNRDKYIYKAAKVLQNAKWDSERSCDCCDLPESKCRIKSRKFNKTMPNTKKGCSTCLK